MTPDLSALWRPSWELIAGIERLHPGIAFHSARYAAAMISRGAAPVAIVFHEGKSLVAGCMAFVSGPWQARRLEIPSLADMPDWSRFTRGLTRICRRELAWNVSINTYGSSPLSLPMLPGLVTRRPRLEHILPLDQPVERLALAAPHRHQIRRARRLGLFLRRSGEPAHVAEHVEAVESSLRRRRLRGENAPDSFDRSSAEALLRSRAGELYQIVDEDAVHASALVLTSERSGYYHSAGVTSMGRHTGASHYLVYRICESLRDDGKQVLNLGGAGPDNPGLLRFKQGFGANPVRLEAAQVDLAPDFIRRSARLLRDSAARMIAARRRWAQA
jgi:hypothetical protein